MAGMVTSRVEDEDGEGHDFWRVRLLAFAIRQKCLDERRAILLASGLNEGLYYQRVGKDNRTNAVLLGGCPYLGADYCCEIYSHRPQACQDLEVGGEDCAIARQ